MFASLAIRLFCVCMTVCRGRRGGCKMGQTQSCHPPCGASRRWMKAQQARNNISSCLLGLSSCGFQLVHSCLGLQVLARAEEEERILRLVFSLLVVYCYRTNGWEEMKLEISWAFIIFDEMTTTPVPCSHYSCCFLLFFENFFFFFWCVKYMIRCELFFYNSSYQALDNQMYIYRTKTFNCIFYNNESPKNGAVLLMQFLTMITFS